MAVPAFNGVPFWLSSHLNIDHLCYYIIPLNFVKVKDFSPPVIRFFFDAWNLKRIRDPSDEIPHGRWIKELCARGIDNAEF